MKCVGIKVLFHSSHRFYSAQGTVMTLSFHGI